jgi:hypothetical protein
MFHGRRIAIRHAAVGRIEKTVFVSYRRADQGWGQAIFGDLTQHGYDVFIDYDGIASGNFETAILENIKARAHFLVLLTPTTLDRCGDPKDWMRREIEAALDDRRNIVPLMLAGFNFGTPTSASQLTGKLAVLKQYNGLPIPEGYFPQAMDRLRNRFLNVPVDAVLHPASDSAQRIAKEQKDKAAMALGSEQRKQSKSQAKLQTAAPPRDQLDHPNGTVHANTSTTNDAFIVERGRKLLDAVISKLGKGDLHGWAWVVTLFAAGALLWIFGGNIPKPSLEGAASVVKAVEDMAVKAYQHPPKPKFRPLLP